MFFFCGNSEILPSFTVCTFVSLYSSNIFHTLYDLVCCVILMKSHVLGKIEFSFSLKFKRLKAASPNNC